MKHIGLVAKLSFLSLHGQSRSFLRDKVNFMPEKILLIFGFSIFVNRLKNQRVSEGPSGLK